MKIGILTFHCARNYGAVLQAYALQKTLEKIDSANSVEFIDYQPTYITNGYMNFKISPFTLKTFIAGLFHYHSRRTRHSKFSIFERELLTVSSQTTLDGSISENKYDAVVCGSDQIWNPRITKGFDKTFFCDFVSGDNNCKKIAYAASFGVNKLTKTEVKQLAKLVDNFDYVSMRELEGVSLIDKLFVKNEIVKTLDPTLLLDKDQWSSLAILPVLKEPYLLVYRMDGNDKLIEDAYFIAQQMNLKIVEITYGRSLKKIFSQRHKIITMAGPREFIGLIKNADFVLTNSFHGTVFSIIFQKYFLTYPVGHLSSRMTSLLDTLGLSGRFITGDDAHLSYNRSINYPVVETKLNFEKDKSSAFLIKALGH